MFKFEVGARVASDTLWALAPSGTDWSAAAAANPLFTAVVKGYIRHDLFVQQIYADFPTELTTRYGPGLQQLLSSPEPGSQPAGNASTA